MLSTNCLRNFIEPDATIIDVGARDGDSLSPFLPILKEGSHMIAFEPIEKEMASLIKMFEDNDIPKDRFSCNQFAIHSKTGEFDFLYDTENRNGGLREQLDYVSEKSFKEIKFVTDSVWDKKTKVDCYRWQDLEEDLKNKMLKASFIKVDTEGSDIIVLKELLPVINKTRPFILFEWYPGTEKEFFSFVNENKYNFVNIHEEVICMSPDMKTINKGYNVPLTMLSGSKDKDLFLVPFEKFNISQ